MKDTSNSKDQSKAKKGPLRGESARGSRHPCEQRDGCPAQATNRKMKGLLLLPCLAAAAPNAWRRWRRQQQQQMPEPVAPEWTKEMPRTWEPANSLKDWRGVAPACAWCAHVDQKHAYCQGFGGRFCDDGVEKLSLIHI